MTLCPFGKKTKLEIEMQRAIEELRLFSSQYASTTSTTTYGSYGVVNDYEPTIEAHEIRGVWLHE